MQPSAISPSLVRILGSAAPDLLADLLTPGKTLTADVVSVFQDRAILSFGRGIRLEVSMQVPLQEGQRVTVQVQRPAAGEVPQPSPHAAAQQGARAESRAPAPASPPLLPQQAPATVRPALAQAVPQAAQQGAPAPGPASPQEVPAAVQPMPAVTVAASQTAEPAALPSSAAPVPTPQSNPSPAPTAPAPQSNPAPSGTGPVPAPQSNPSPTGPAPGAPAPAAQTAAPTAATPLPIAQRMAMPPQPASPADTPAPGAQRSAPPQAAPLQPAPLQPAPLQPAPQPAIVLKIVDTRPQTAPLPAPDRNADVAAVAKQAGAASVARESGIAAPAGQAITQTQPSVQQPATPQVLWLPIPLPDGTKGWAQLHVQEDDSPKTRAVRGGPVHQVRIWWETPNLGAVQVTMEAGANSLSTMFTAAMGDVRAALEQTLPDLQERLTAAGFPDARLGARLAAPGETLEPVRVDGANRLDRRL